MIAMRALVPHPAGCAALAPGVREPRYNPARAPCRGAKVFPDLMSDPARTDESTESTHVPLAMAMRVSSNSSSRDSITTSPGATSRRSTSGRACCFSIVAMPGPAPISNARAVRWPSGSDSPTSCCIAARPLSRTARSSPPARLLTAAVEQGAPTEVALAYLERLDRLSGVSLPAEAPPELLAADVDQHRRVAGAAAPSRRGRLCAGPLRLDGRGRGARGSPAPLARWLRWGVPSAAAGSALPARRAAADGRASDVALTRARTLFETGHAGDAIRLLGTIPLADPNRAEADRVLADIQRALLTAADPSSGRHVSPVR